ncbi:MAG TPA: amylo-alpha-1,6-glucosidase [Polyangiaceae bacterium]
MKPKPERASDFWRASRDGPWPSVVTSGELERADRQWMHTNGAGAYSMSTLALMHTRRYHGIFAAALTKPSGRYVIVSHADTTVDDGQRSYRLATHQFPNLAPTPGYRLLHSFAQDPLPRWIYRLGNADIERKLGLVRGQNAIVLAYTWYGRSPARLSFRPLMPLRPAHQLTREHGAMKQKVTLRTGAVEIQPVPQLAPITFGHGGVFMGSPDWWRRFEYLEDRECGLEFQEDMWTPGVFEIGLQPDQTSYLVISVGALPNRPPAELLTEAADFLRARDPGPTCSPAVRTLWVFAEQFCLDKAERPCLLAGYPVLDVRSRDTLLSIPGLLLSRGLVELAKEVLTALLAFQRGGLLCDSVDGKRRTPVPDASLWLFETARELIARSGAGDAFVQDRLYPALVRTFARVRSPTSRWVRLTADGLVANGAEDRALTWMDAQIGTRLVTPRRGLAVEFQALWSKGCETLALLAEQRGDAKVRALAENCSRAARIAFKARFWCHETDYPFDCISEDGETANAWADPAIRPNALVALAIDPELFEDWQTGAILERVEEELLTERGPRSLSPRDQKFVGYFGGTLAEQEAAYHQGTAWPHLFGFFARARARFVKGDPESLAALRQGLELAVDDGPVLGSVAQLANGDAPHRPAGCPAYAAAVAELLRALVTDLPAAEAERRSSEPGSIQ